MVAQEDEVIAVYGDLFKSATVEMQIIEQAIVAQAGKTFSSYADCAAWANKYLLDIIVYSKMSHSYLFCTDRGVLLTQSAYKQQFCNDVLRYTVTNSEGEVQEFGWVPTGNKYFTRAKVVGEEPDGVHDPLYYRNYHLPAGYFDKTKKAFNVAKPFPTFAKETGRDTSHIYDYIEHVAGDCAMYLLAWLRMKLCDPLKKTHVVPVIVSRTQGNGKSTFAEVICTALFGRGNVLVTDQYDASAKFNADYADALVISQEETDGMERRQSTAALKSRSTTTKIRKENKGIDPIYQDSYTEFVITTNKDVPVKFDDLVDQRRFMIMEADSEFTRKPQTGQVSTAVNKLADDVFTKLYGEDVYGNMVGIPMVDDIPLIQQFMHELYSNEELKKVNVRDFPHTAAYDRCFSLPRTNEMTDVEATLRAVAPFIQKGLLLEKIPDVIDTDGDEPLVLANYVTTPNVLQYMPSKKGLPPYVALCRPLMFIDTATGKPLSHAIVERSILDCASVLEQQYGLKLLPNMLPLAEGFTGIKSKWKYAPAARFALVRVATTQLSKAPPEPLYDPPPLPSAPLYDPPKQTKGATLDRFRQALARKEKHHIPQKSIKEPFRLRVNDKWQPDLMGVFETTNLMLPGTNTLKDKSRNVAAMDTFLFECDDVSEVLYHTEKEIAEQYPGDEIPASTLYAIRLKAQLAEARRLYTSGVVWRIVYSGAKSYHILVRVQDAPKTLEEYKWLHADLAVNISTVLHFDMSTSDPARLTRAPINVPRITTAYGKQVKGTQRLIEENNSNVYSYEWRDKYQAWKERPLADYERMHKMRLVPMKQEYRDAMAAMLHGTFFTDSVWNGKRQQCFFPAYRLCRHLGYTHEQLWSKAGILDGIEQYYKPNDIAYWRSREKSALIQQIDEEIDFVKDFDNPDSLPGQFTALIDTVFSG